VYDIIHRYEHEGRIESIKQKGRPSKITPHMERVIVRRITNTPKLSAPKLATEVAERSHHPVSSETIRRVLKKHGYSCRTARVKPYISEVNKTKRYQFALKHIGLADNFWNQVIFSDESKFNLFGSDGKCKVWRKPRTALDRKNMNITVKHGGGSVMVWGCFSASGLGSLVFIDGKMDGAMYRKILQQHLRQDADKMGLLDSFYFYQDNDPKHKARDTREWLLYNCPHIMETPPQSPDCNPIEHVWDYLDKHI